MIRRHAVALIALAACLGTGCTNISLAMAQRDLDHLVERQESSFDPEEGWRGVVDLSEGFLDLAKRARSAAGELGLDPRTKVSFLRVAAAAAWQAGDLGEDELDEAVEDGNSTCDALLQKGSAPPRDCAFLRVVTAFHWHKVNLPQIDAWSAARSDSPATLGAEAVPIRDLAGKYYTNTLGILVLGKPEVEKFRGLDASFCGYLETQAREFKEHVVLLQEIAIVAQKEVSDSSLKEELKEFVDEDEVQTVRANQDINQKRFRPSTCPSS
jgi:hypothetical protein